MSGGQLQHQRGLEEWLEKTNKRLAALERSVRLQFSAVDAEGLTFRDGGAATFLSADEDPLVELDQTGLVLYAADGTTKLLDLTTDGLHVVDGSVIVESPGKFIFRQDGEDLEVTPQESKVFHDEGLGNIPPSGSETYSTNFTFPAWASVLNFALLGDWSVEEDSSGNNAHNARFKVEYTHPSLGSQTEQSILSTHSSSSPVVYASRNWGRQISPDDDTLVTVTLTLSDSILFASGGADTQATLVAIFIPSAT